MSILSDRADIGGFYSGILPDGREISVDKGASTGMWCVYIESDHAIGSATSREAAEALGIHWAKTNPRTSILSKEPDDWGYFYGDLPDGRQLRVRYNPATKRWGIYVTHACALADAPTKEDAEALGLAWAINHPDP